ncbi:MAG: hypothetical protein ACI4GZ_06490 [Ruminococcus sp.]
MRIKTKQRLIIANSFLLAFLMCVAVYSWFAVNNKNSVNSNDVTVKADNSLELSVDNTSWYSSIQLSDYEWFNSVKFTDITGLGDGSFLRPVLEQFPDYAQVNSGSAWTTPSAGQDYVKFTLYMRSKDPLVVSLGEDSAVQTIDQTLKSTVDTDILNKSSASEDGKYFSKDIIAGALRISAVNPGGDRLFTWIPRPDIYCSATTSAVTYDSISTAQTSGESFTHKYHSTESDEPVTAKDGIITGSISASNTQRLSALSYNETSQYYEGSVDIYIWLEGTDNEARRAFNGGQFKIYLNIEASDNIASD